MVAVIDWGERLKRLGARIRQLRKAHGWSQVELADFAGVNRSWLSRVESGKIGLSEGPDLLGLVKVARALGPEADDLLAILGIQEGSLLTEHPEQFAPDVVDLALWLQGLTDQNRAAVLRAMAGIREYAETVASRYPEAEPPAPLPRRPKPPID